MTTTESLRKLLQDMVLPELNQIRAEQSEQKNTLRLIHARVDEMSKRLDQVDAHLIDQSRRIDATNARIDATNARIDQLRSDLSERIDQVHSELSERIERVHADMILRNDETNRSIARLYEVIVRRDEHADVAARLSRLEHEVAELSKKVAA